MLQDCSIALIRFTLPCPHGNQSRYLLGNPFSWYQPGSLMMVEGVIIFSSNPVNARKGLTVDAGG